MKTTKMTRDKFKNDLPSIICAYSASSQTKIDMIMNMLDKYTANLANDVSTKPRKNAFLYRVMCCLFGHKIDRSLIERTKMKTCKRCGKELMVWDVMTHDEMVREANLD